jgi:uncharacterized membrane protein
MTEVSPYKVYTKMLIYAFITMLISFLSLIDNINDISSVTSFEWIKMVAKSIIAALISVKAYLDNSGNSDEIKIEEGETDAK